MAIEQINKPKYRPKIANRFKQTREESGLTIQETSEKMGFNLSYVKAVEYGYMSPNIDFLIRWHNIFSKSYEWILEGIK